MIAFAIGYIIGIKSKAIAKIKAREKIKEEPKFNINEFIRDEGGAIKKVIKGRVAPPPPPPSRIIKEGTMPTPPKKKVEHVKPGITYYRGTFTKVNRCGNCEAIGMQSDMWAHNPCPKCGGNVKYYGAGKWENSSWVMSKV